jgi:hypothetical protein
MKQQERKPSKMRFYSICNSKDLNECMTHG